MVLFCWYKEMKTEYFFYIIMIQNKEIVCFKMEYCRKNANIIDKTSITKYYECIIKKE